jgi:hypothetical protein
VEKVAQEQLMAELMARFGCGQAAGSQVQCGEGDQAELMAELKADLLWAGCGKL